jgi:Ni/Fe-hydrogenase 1 B-type cytochrome subunit
MRFVHFVTAFVFTTSVLFRIYWAFAGNRYSRWNQFLPVSRARLRDAGHMLAYYLFLRRHPPTTVGHNALAGATYFVVYLLLLLQIFTGFALYALPFDAGTFWSIAFGWMTTAFGTQPVRLVHTILMWLFLAFTIHHVYSATLIDIEKRAGLMSSIFTGFQSLTPAQLVDAQVEENPPPKNRRPFWTRFSRKAGPCLMLRRRRILTAVRKLSCWGWEICCGATKGLVFAPLSVSEYAIHCLMRFNWWMVERLGWSY